MNKTLPTITLSAFLAGGCVTGFSNNNLVSQGDTIAMSSSSEQRAVNGSSHDQLHIGKIHYEGKSLDDPNTPDVNEAEELAFQVQMADGSWQFVHPSRTTPNYFFAGNDLHIRINSSGTRTSPHDNIYALVALEADELGSLSPSLSPGALPTTYVDFSGKPLEFNYREHNDLDVTRSKIIEEVTHDLKKAGFEGVDDEFFTFIDYNLGPNMLGKTFVRRDGFEDLEINYDVVPGHLGWNGIETTVRSLKGHVYGLAEARIGKMPDDWRAEKLQEQEAPKALRYRSATN